MVVLAASVTTKHGKGSCILDRCVHTVLVLLSRQFVDITQSRIESLLAAFPKLRDSLGDSAKQHTLVETTSVRYLYQKIEDLFLVVITSKSSNIVEDLATLQVLSRVVCTLGVESAEFDDVFERLLLSCVLFRCLSTVVLTSLKRLSSRMVSNSFLLLMKSSLLVTERTCPTSNTLELSPTWTAKKKSHSRDNRRYTKSLFHLLRARTKKEKPRSF